MEEINVWVIKSRKKILKKLYILIFLTGILFDESIDALSKLFLNIYPSFFEKLSKNILQPFGMIETIIIIVFILVFLYSRKSWKVLTAGIIKKKPNTKEEQWYKEEEAKEDILEKIKLEEKKK